MIGEMLVCIPQRWNAVRYVGPHSSALHSDLTWIYKVAHEFPHLESISLAPVGERDSP